MTLLSSLLILLIGVLMRSNSPRHQVSAPAIGGRLCAIGGLLPLDEHLLHRADLRGTDAVAKLSLQTRRLSDDHDDGVMVT